MLEDIDPTLDWVVESHPIEFGSDKDIGIDLDLQIEALAEVAAEHNVQLNADPLVPGPAPSPPFVEVCNPYFESNLQCYWV